MKLYRACMNPCDAKQIADKVLDEFVEIATTLNVDYVLILGTCLGFVRDKGYIKGDNDIDVGVSCKGDSAKYSRLTVTLLKNGFKTDYKTTCNQHFVKYGILLDVYFGYLVGTTEPITYNGKTYRIPSDVEKHLEKHFPKERWGVDWRTPFYRDVGYAFVVGDLFHIGHLQFLEKCKALCLYLIVGVLTDEACASYKRQPIIPLAERKRIIEALKCVDRVVIQHARDPTETMKEIVHDGVVISLLFHAGWKTVPGTEYVESIGGKLIQPPYYEGQSTTKIIEKIRSLK